MAFLYLEISHSSREKLYVTDIAKSGDIKENSLEPQTESAVRNSSESAKRKVAYVIILVHTSHSHCFQKLFGVRLSLAAADYLADTWHKQVGCGNGLAVSVLLHVEGLDVLWIVNYEHRLVEHGFGNVSFVLGLQIAAPFYRVLEFHARLFQNVNSVGVVKNLELAVHNLLELFSESRLKSVLKEFDFVRALLEHGVDNELDELLGDFDNVRKLGKCNLRLDLPKFRCVTGGVAVFGTEEKEIKKDFKEKTKKINGYMETLFIKINLIEQ